MATTDTATNKHKKASILPWSPLVAGVIVIAVYFGTQIAGALALFAYGLLIRMSNDDIENWLTGSTVAQFANSVIVYGLMAYLIYLFAKRYKVRMSTFGVVWPRFKDIGVALLGVVPYVMGYAILLTVATQLFPSINVEQEQQLGFDTSQTQVGLILTFVSLVVLPPIVEELVMRGFLFTSLLKRFRFLGAAILTSIVFAAAHLQFGSGAPLLWVAALDTFILSIILCIMRYKTGSLWPGIFLHALKNLVAFLSIFIFKIT
ncbi:MAG: hypothetical protein JWP13_487 [Candidatus Saccharibacteria bacterium]|nr:hypothetical protein [Candidatus Saccharibacteria bacterium]